MIADAPVIRHAVRVATLARVLWDELDPVAVAQHVRRQRPDLEPLLDECLRFDVSLLVGLDRVGDTPETFVEALEALADMRAEDEPKVHSTWIVNTSGQLVPLTDIREAA